MELQFVKKNLNLVVPVVGGLDFLFLFNQEKENELLPMGRSTLNLGVITSTLLPLAQSCCKYF